MIVNVVSMTRKETSTGKPMWTCRTDNAEVKSFNVFEPPLEGFEPEMNTMKVDEVINWSKPIECIIYEKGKYWNFGGLKSPRDGHEVVKPYVPDFAQWRTYAIETCKHWVRDTDGATLDTETDGVNADSRIVCIVVSPFFDDDEYTLEKLVYHPNPDKIPDIVQIDRAALKTAPNWESAYDKLKDHNLGGFIVAYNAPFDQGRIDFMNASHNLPPLLWLKVVDAMPIVSWFLGLWDAGQQRWKSIKQTEAYAQIVGGEYAAHGALADAKALKEIIHAIAKADALDALAALHDETLTPNHMSAGFDHD